MSVFRIRVPSARIFLLSIVICLPSEAAKAQQTTLPPPGYVMSWNDEFEGTTLNLAKWRVRYPGIRDGAMVTSESVTLNGRGQLLLTTFYRNGLMNTGMIGTQQTFRQRYGYFEARIKFQASQGHHGCFWLQSPTYGQIVGNPAASGTEIDIAEFFGSGRTDKGLFSTVWWNPYASPSSVKITPNLSKVLRPVSRKHVPELSNDFHVYALLWTPSAYIFYVDGIEVGRTTTAVSQVPEYIVLSLLSSAWERPRLPLRNLPESMTVDYVRVYASQN
ncbi:family 16 glycosylhydrolase [bacterium]|nr:family 16 glycosylhydrolase [bacterium]